MSKGIHMANELLEAPQAFTRALAQHLQPIKRPSAIYTFARGSSDAVASILSYELMEQLGIPATSMPPSIFSLGGQLDLGDALGLLISQSGGSADLIACAEKLPRSVGIVNAKNTPLQPYLDQLIPVQAGCERAVPATKTVVGSIAAGMTFISAMDAGYQEKCVAARDIFESGLPELDNAQAIMEAIIAAEHIYVLGRRATFGVAQEIALKLKETCAIHAEAYSASEVLHGPLQLSTKAVTIISLHSSDNLAQQSLDIAEARFAQEGAQVLPIDLKKLGLVSLPQPAMAAAFLCLLYPVIYKSALALGYDPDQPKTLMKVTNTR